MELKLLESVLVLYGLETDTIIVSFSRDGEVI